MTTPLDLTHRFYVFAFCQYYPAGGLGDIAGTANTLAEAHSILLDAARHNDAVTIYDRMTGGVVEPEEPRT